MASLLTPVVLATAPFLDTLTYGQINVLLMGGCYLALVRYGIGPWFGIAVGIAAAVKLTPLALLLVPLMLWRWRTIVIAGLAFCLPQLVTLIFLPNQTTAYWGSIIWNPSRVGDVGFIDNLSLRGVLVRMDAPTWVWVLATILAVGVSAMAIWRHRRMDPTTLIGFAAGCMLLISPVSWLHHFVWWPIIAAGWLRGARRRAATVLAVLLALTLAVSPKHVLTWTRWGQDSLSGLLLAATPALLILAGAWISAQASRLR